jgi:hypothetical protein
MSEGIMQEICGLPYTVAQPKKPQWGNHRKVAIRGGARPQTPKPRFIVQGCVHKNGQPIRFKSLDNAERHIKTMGLGK